MSQNKRMAARFTTTDIEEWAMIAMLDADKTSANLDDTIDSFRVGKEEKEKKRKKRPKRVTGGRRKKPARPKSRAKVKKK